MKLSAMKLLTVLVLLPLAASARTPLTADVTYYATPSGGGDCLTPATACTPQEAWNGIRDRLDLNCHRVVVEMAEGNYGTLDLIGALTGPCGADAVTFRGNVEHPERVNVDGGRSNAITVHEGAWVKLDGLQLASAEPDFNFGGRGLVVWDAGRALVGTLAFGLCTTSAIGAGGGGEIHAERSALYINGLTAMFGIAEDGGKLWLNGASITPTAPYSAFTNGMFHTSRGGLIDLSGTILEPGPPLFGYIAIAESNSVIVILGMRYPPNMGRPQVRYGGQIIP